MHSFEPEDQPVTLAPRPEGARARMRLWLRFFNPNYLLRPRTSSPYTSVAPRRRDGSRTDIFYFNASGGRM